MAVVIETTIGDFTVDLFVDSRPQACKNFLKLCKLKYYNFCLFHSVQPNFLAQTGDPTGVGTGGESIYGVLYGENARYFEAEVMPKLRHKKQGLLSMVNCGSNMLGSQFFITLGEDLVSLDGEHCVFGEITEGSDIVLKFNEAICDVLHRPYKDIRITHTVVLEDPFEDPSGLIIPDMSPEATQERLAGGRIGADEEVDPAAGLTAAQVEELRQEREARARATILEIVGDLPDAEMAPPENVLFVCKLNPVTSDDDLEIIFSRFGKVKSCEVIRDKNTGDSLQYAFVEFEDQKSCEEAFFKMDNVLIDDRRIHVDFSQSVAKMRWRGKGRGIEYFDNKDQPKEVKSSSHRDREREDSRTRSSRREREYEEREKRRDRGRDREDERIVRERGKERDGDDRHRRREDRDRSRSDWRKRDSKHREDDKRYDSKRREADSFRKRDEDSKSGSSRSRKVEEKKEEKRSDDKRLDEHKRERDINGRSSSRQAESDKNGSLEKISVRKSMEKLELKEKEKEKNLKYISSVPNVTKDETFSDSLNDSQELPSVGEELEKNPHHSVHINNTAADINVEDKVEQTPRRSSKEERQEEKAITEEIEDTIENNENADDKMSQKSDKTKPKKAGDKTKGLKRKRKVSETRKRKKRRHSSSSDSSSESSDSSESSSSSESSDYRHNKRKKLIVAKRYYKGGKLVKEIKKKKRTKETSDSESLSEESSDSDPKRKRKSKKHKKVINIFKQSKKKSVKSSDDESQTESSSSEDSDARGKKKKKRKIVEKHSKKKLRSSGSKKKRKQKDETSSSSDSEDSVQNQSPMKKHKKDMKHNSSLTSLNRE